MSVPSHVTHVRDRFVSEAIAGAEALVKAFESSSFTLQLLRPSSTLIAQCEIVQVLLGHQLLRQALDGFALLPSSEQRLRRTWLARTLRTFLARHAELEAVADFLEAEDGDLGMTWEERFEPSHAWILAHEATEEDLRELGLRRSDWDAFMQGRAPVATLVLAGSLAIASDPDDPLQMYTDALFEVRVGVGHLAFESCTGLERIRARLEELVSTASSISPPDDAASMARKLHDLNNRTVVPGEWRAIADRLLTQMSVPPAERAARNLPEETYRADLPLLSGQRAAEAILYGEPHEPQHALFFEGGGPRGLVAHAGLTELQRLLGAYESANHSIYHSFDMVAGSGIGGALAALVFGLGLELPRMSQFFHELVRAVFARQAPSQAQPRPEVLAERQEAARAVAHKFVSEAADNGKAPPCSVVLVLQCAHQDQPDTLAPFIFYTGKVDDDVAGQFFKERAVRLQRPTADVMADPKQAHKLVENWTTAVLATCAAPWLMKAVTFEDVSLIDGSVSSNCPAMVVWPLLRSTLSAERPLASVTCLGTGQASGSQRPRVSFHSSKDPSLAGVLNIVRGTTSGVPPWDTFCAEVGSNVYDKLVADEPLLTRIDPQFEFEFLDKIDRTDVDTQLVIADLAKRNAAITMPTLVQRLVSSLPTPTPGNVTQLTYEEEAFLWQSAAFVHLSARPEDAQRAKQSCGRFTVSQLEGMLKALDKKLVRDEAHAQSFDLRRPDEDASVSGTPVVTVTFVYQRMQPGDAKSQALVYKERRQHLKQLEKLQPQLHHQTYRYQRLLAVGEHDSGDGDRFFVTVTAGRRENSQTLEQLVGANTLSFADRAFILVDVWRALQHLWSIKYVYRAIDLSSVLLDKLDPQDSDSDGLRRHYAVQLGDMYLAKTKQARTLLTQEEWRGEDTADLKLMLGRFGRLMVTVLRGELLTEEESAPGKPCPLIPEDVAAAVSDTHLKNAIKQLGKLAGTCWREAEKRPSMSRMGMRMTQITDDLEGLGSSRRNLHVRPGGCTCALCTGSTLGTRPVGSPRDRKYFAAEQCTLELDGQQKLLWKELATACNGHEVTMSNWKPEDVARWLSQVLGSDLAETMVETHRVNGRMLQNLKLKDLEGSLERPSALAVLDAIERLKHNHAKLRAITDAFGVYLLPGTPKSLVLPNTLPVVLPQQLVFDKRRMIGQGKFGSVYHTVLQDAHGRQRDVAVKVPKEPTECDENKLAEMRAAELVEILCLAKVGGHDNVVELLGVCENVLDAAGPCPVLAYHENGDLLSFLQRHKNGETWDQDSCRVMELLRGIVAGVAHVHEVGLVHGDLRLDNVVLTSKHVPRISDFGHARCSGGRWPQRKQQPLRRMPPEYFTGHHYDCSGDVWMLGLLLADVLRMTEVDPFDVASSCWDDLEEEARALIDSDVPAPNVGLEEAVRGAVAEPEHQELLLEVIGKCLAIDANERFQDAGEVLKALDGQKDVC